MRVRDERPSTSSALRRQPLVEAEADEPGGDLLEPDGRRREDARSLGSARPRPASRRAARRTAARSTSRAGRGSSGSCRRSSTSASPVAAARDERDQEPLRDARQHVLDRDRGRVDVGERLSLSSIVIARARGSATPPAGRDGGRQRLRVGESRARGRAGCRARCTRSSARSSRAPAPQNALRRVAREARVVGGERRPRDDAARSRGRRLAERREPALARLRPERVQVGLRRSPTRSGTPIEKSSAQDANFRT